MGKTGSRQVSYRLFILAALAFAVGSAGAAATGKPKNEIRAFRPVADTYVTAALPGANFGRSRILQADASPPATAYLRFELVNVQGDIDSVTLLLHPRAGPRESYEVRRVDNDRWRERRMTYRTAPRLSLRYASSKPVRRGVWSAVDVTSFVSSDEGVVSLAITTRSPRGISFASRESRQSPRLVIRTERR